MSDLGRSILNALWPEGAFWEPKPCGFYDNLLNGIAANNEAVRDDLDNLRYVRDPLKTPVLDALEKDYGIVPASGATEAERRAILKAFKYQKTNSGAYDILQEKLIEAGFDVYVYVNDPAVDPSQFVGDVLGGSLIINDPRIKFEYDIPSNPGYWHLFFFIGGPAEYDPEYGLISIDPAGIAGDRRKTLKTLVLKYKPLHSWGVYVDDYSLWLDGSWWLDGVKYLSGFEKEI
jgi:hypothetical protein